MTARPFVLGSTLRKETTMPNYVDGFLLPIPKKNFGAYRRSMT